MTRSAKVMLLGSIAVGKTSLANRLVFDKFDTNYKTTIGVNVMTHDARLPAGDALRLILWDTDGDFGETLMASTYILGAAGAVIVADATRPTTIDHMNGLALEFARRMPGRPIQRVVNKVDLLTDGERGDLAQRGGAITLTSARTAEGVLPMFATLAVSIVQRGL